MLEEYDVASWHSTDAVQALHPPAGSVGRYIAKRTDSGWTVMYGRLSEDRGKFLIVYEAIQGATPEQFTVKEHDPPLEDTGFFLNGARGIETALQDFNLENRRYNVYILPAESDLMYVYVLPAQTVNGIFPLGGDARYLISANGLKIVEKRQLHKSILEIKYDSSSVAGVHSHVLSDVPEDTDVFHALTRKPAIPEYIGAGKRTYVVLPDASIKIAN